MQTSLRVTFGAIIFCAAMSAHAAELKWTSAGDILTFDIHAQNENLNSTACSAVYESLVRFGVDRQVEPQLATSWRRVPEGFLFDIRQGVKFHEGQTLTADDVVFSIRRALSPKSQFKSATAGIKDAVKVGPYQVLIKTTSGSPVILNQLTDLRIMNYVWAKQHGALEPQDFVNKQEAYAARHANGTGPFRLKERVVDVRTVFETNPDWWDQKNRRGNLTTVTYMPIQSAATRTAALLSGQVDFVLDPATQDLRRLQASSDVKILEGAENRVLMIAMDLARDASPYLNAVNGKPLGVNPLKDQRVREALSIAVNRAGMVRGVMRGSAVATGTIVAANVNGWTARVAQVPKYDLARAKQLMAEAGYPEGFAMRLDTPNNRWVNDENICKALAGMWAKIGVKVTVNSMPRAQYFPKVLSFDTTAALVGWGATTFDALYSLQSLSMTFNAQTGEGLSNIGRASVPEMDALIRQIRVEENAQQRNALIAQALELEKRLVLHIPLHEQMIPWAMRSDVDVIHRPDNRLTFEWINVRR